MAVAGSAVVAYKCEVVDGVLSATKTTYPRSLCADIKTVMDDLGKGQEMIVAGADMPRLRQMLAAQGIIVGKDGA